jgi:ankyrin repeat protein
MMQDEYGNTPLIQACRWGHFETAKVLVHHGANVDQKNNVSSSFNIKFWLNKNTNSNIHYSSSPIMWSNGFCILQSGKTALNLACYWKESEIINLLLKAGARTDIQEEVAI